MNKEITIAEELKQIAPEVQWPSQVPFAVPEGYFDSLADAILFQIRIGDLKAPVYTVPEGYFEQLPNLILQKVKEEEADPALELAEISPFLASIPKNQTFTVPAGYFDSLPSATPVRPLFKRTWVKLAVAASLTLLAGSPFLIKTLNNTHPPIERQLEKFDEQDLLSYLQNHIDPLENESFMATSTVPHEEASFVQEQLDNEIAPEALEQYLQQTGLSKDVLPDNK
jgi:hypothetical protein